MLLSDLLLLTVTKASKAPSSKVQIRTLTAKDLPAVQRLWTRINGIELAEGDSLSNL